MATHGGKLPEHASVFQAEVCAIQRAAEYIQGYWALFTVKHIRIYVDSMAALQAIDRFKATSKLISSANTALNLAGRITATLQLNWVKAHVGFPGNKLAD